MTQTFIYAIYNEFENIIKIGFSNDPVRRLDQLQTSLVHRLDLLLTFVGTSELETKIHRQLKKYRLKGEWFEANQEVFQVLNTEYLESISKRFAKLNKQSSLQTLQNELDEYFNQHKKAKRIKFKTIADIFSELPDMTEQKLKLWLEELGYRPKPDVNRVLWYTDK